jgi:hypothetical protein
MNDTAGTQQTRPSSQYLESFSYWKAAALLVASVAAAWVMGWYLKDFALHSFSITQIGLSLGLSVVGFLALFFLSVFMIGRPWWISAGAVASGCAVLINFAGVLNQRVAIGGTVLIVLLVVAAREGRREVETFMELKFFRIAKTVMSRTLLALALFVAVLFFDVFATQPLTGDNPLLPQGIFERSLEGLSARASGLTGGVDFSKTLRQISHDAVKTVTLGGSLPPGAQEIAQTLGEKKILDEYQRWVQSLTGSQINPDQRLSSAIYESMLTKFNTLAGKTKNYVVAALTLLLFITVLALSPVLRIIAATVAFIIYEILVALRFAAKVYESRSKEVIVLT